MNSGQRPKSSYVRGQSAFAALWSILVLLAGLVVLPIAAHAAFTEIGPSPLGDENGTSYGIRVPDNYNGLLIIDLDYVTARNSARATYWLGKGYAYAGINRPPLERTPPVVSLFRHAQKLASELGIEIAESSTGGGSDGNFTAALGLPTLDGLGVDGDGAHTHKEHLIVSSIEPGTRLMQGLFETLQ